jgi:hypothetical protein
VLLGTVMPLVTACRGRSGASVLAAPERARVYAAVLQEVRRDSSSNWIVVDSLMPTHDVDAELQDKVLSDLAITQGALRAFLHAQRTPADHFRTEMLPDARWSRVSPLQLDSLRALARADVASGAVPRGPRNDGFWQHWYRTFPGSGGYVILAPASIAADGSSAVVHVRVACGPLCGEAELRVLHRDASGTWHTTGRVRLSES